MDEERKITLASAEGEIELYVIEETRISGVNYLLVTDAADDDEDADCFILKDMSKQEDTDALYEFVESEEELDSLMRIFSELLEDVDLEKE